MTLKIIFWLLLIILFYTYIGYLLVLFVLNVFRNNNPKEETSGEFLPGVSLLIPAYNEFDFLRAKIDNINSLNYPADKLDIIWIIDGSDDGSYEYLKDHTDHTILHQRERAGKSAAINMGMQKVKEAYTIITDANTALNREAIRNIIGCFKDERTGCVAGEKRISQSKGNNTVSSGEGIYWRYESLIKKLESGLKTTIGGAGELLAIKTNLYREIDKDIINDDFFLSLMIIRQRHRIKYCPGAYATERPSADIKEEIRRKSRIAAGGVQIVFKLPEFLNIIKYGSYSFQYISHKVLRWTIAPLAFFIIPFINLFIVINNAFKADIYLIVLIISILFILLTFIGFIAGGSRSYTKHLILPYYITMMNISTLMGIARFLGRKQSSKWDKSKRMT